MGLRDARLLRRILPDQPSTPRAKVVVVVANDEKKQREEEPALTERPRTTSFGHQVGRMLDESWGDESEERLSIGTLPPRVPEAAPSARAEEEASPARPPTILDGSWQRELEDALDALEAAPVDEAERKRLSKDPGLVELKEILARGPVTKEEDQKATRRIKRGDLQGALDALTDAIDAHKTHPQPWTKRGIARARSGDLKGAVEDYSRALELDPEYLPAWANRGSASFHLGQHESAARDCTRAIELAPNLAQAWLFRGIARAKLGEAESGKDLYTFLDLCPYSPWVKLIRDTLKQIENWDEDDSDEEGEPLD